MNASASDSSSAFGGTSAFVGFNSANAESDGQTAAGIASLDSEALQSTKSEIRALAAEIAHLASTPLESTEFYEAFLPRLCVAMGARGAGVWSYRVEGPVELIARHAFPNELLGDPLNATSSITPQLPESIPDSVLEDHRANHMRILRCVASEGQPILVPPSTVTLECDRPKNPLPDNLIIVPVRVQDDVEFLLEVIQRSGGGPAAQRGYLRFVAQMADLLADYLRRQNLRELKQNSERLGYIENWLTSIAGAKNSRFKRTLAANAVSDLLSADRVFVLNSALRWRVIAVSGAQNFDPRSESVLAAQLLQRGLIRGSETDLFKRPQWFAATDRRSDATRDRSSASQLAPNGPPINSVQQHVDQLCMAIGCRKLLCIALDDDRDFAAIVGFEDAPSKFHAGLSDQTSSDRRFLIALGALLSVSSNFASAPLPWLRRFVFGTPKARKAGVAGTAWIVQAWILRAALIGLLLAVAMFPVPQQISVTATLEPSSKQMYYAPMAGIVTTVNIDEGEPVETGTVLMQITSHELESRAMDLELELKKTQDQITETAGRLIRRGDLSAFEANQLDYEQRELETMRSSLERQIAETTARLTELTITARQSGSVSTWDLRNRMLNHPVQAGQLLASTFDPNDKWRLHLAVPDYRAGIVADAMSKAASGTLPVSFSLSSHPDTILQAHAATMAPQVTVQTGNALSPAERIVRTEASIIDATALPLKQDGAIARAVVDCGKISLCWLVIRDAYWAISSRVKMMW